MNELEVRIFLDKYNKDLKHLIDKFNYRIDKPCDLMPWLVIDVYLSGKFPEGFYKKEVSELHEKTETFKSIISVLNSFSSDYGDLISAISQSSNEYKRNYEFFIKKALEDEIEKTLKGKDWTFDKTDLLSNNQYKSLYEICNSNLEILSKIHVGFGFKCELSEKTVEAIFNSMVSSKQISGNLTDFQAIFANTPTQVKNPVKWLNKSQKKPYRGHQTKLYLFIETMLNGKFSADDKRKAVDLFIDEKGKFFNPKMKEPNENDRDTHNIFETLINNTKEKTRHA